MSPKPDKKEPGVKDVAYELIDPESHKAMYRLLAQLVDKFHHELSDARIALAWNTAWKPDKDGRVTLGKCRKASDLDRELAPYDLVIILRKEFWTHPLTSERHHKALLDHELMHATVALGEDGEPKVDTRGRVVYRLRKHDIEEFGEVVNRWGLWKKDLIWFVKQIPGTEQPSLREADAPQPRDNALTQGPTTPTTH